MTKKFTKYCGVKLTEEQHAIAKKYGNGNVSSLVRELLDLLVEDRIVIKKTGDTSIT